LNATTLLAKNGCGIEMVSGATLVVAEMVKFVQPSASSDHNQSKGVSLAKELLAKKKKLDEVVHIPTGLRRRVNITQKMSARGELKNTVAWKKVGGSLASRGAADDVTACSEATGGKRWATFQ
jgi:hypothetical protein